MKTKEFYEKLINIGPVEHISVHYDENFAGSVRMFTQRSKAIVLSNEFNPKEFNDDVTVDSILETVEYFLDEDYDVVFRCPSKGFYRIIDLKKVHRDYSSDGDGVYDELVIYCEEKPFCPGDLPSFKKYQNNRLTEGYAVQNIDEKNQKVIEALRTGLKSNIEKCLKEIDSLKSAVSLYRDSITDFVDLSIEKSDIVAKYSKANNGGTYNLPGVFASSMGAYDLNAMRADNQRIEQVKSMYEVAEGQKDTYFKMIVRAQNEMKLYLTAIARINADLDVYLEQLAQETSWESNKNIKK